MLKRDKNNTLKKVSAMLIIAAVSSTMFTGMVNVNAEEKAAIVKEYTNSEYDPVYLDVLTPSKISIGYGQLVYDKASGGGKITLLDQNKQEVIYKKGIGAHAASEVVYNIEGKDFLYFDAFAGVDRNSGSYNGQIGTCNFKVYVDNTLVFESGILNKNMPAKHVNVNVEGAKEVRLVATDGGDGNYCDHASWGDAKFLVKAVPEVVSNISFGANHKWLEEGEKSSIASISAYTNKGNRVTLDKGSYVLKSDNEDIVNVNNDGEITAISSGVANIICIATIDGTVVEGALEVIVGDGNYEGRWVTASPDGTNKIGIAIEDGNLVYYATDENKVVIDQSTLGMKTSIGTLGVGATLKGIENNAIDESYNVISGKKSTNINKANETIYTFTQGDIEFGVVVRAYDDGVAYRYIIDGEEGQVLNVTEETTTFKIPDGSKTKAMDFIAHYEGFYNPLNSNELIGEFTMPLLYETEDGVWGLITESGLFGDYVGTIVQGMGNGLLKTKFSPQQGNKAASVKLPFQSPWRTVVMGTPKEIAETVIVENLNPPTKIEDTSWIKPGTTSWTWLNGDPTNDYDTYVNYVDLAYEMGWDYVLLDEGWQPKSTNNDGSQYAGYYPWFDDLMDYANSKGIGVLVWAPNWDLDTEAKREQRLVDWGKKGIKGIKVDFFNSESQKTMQLYDEITKKSAENHLLVNYHGTNKPTGERRTYPNILNKEGIFGMEHFKWSPGMTAEQTTTTPFTRNAVGPMDFTPTATFVNGHKNFSLAHLNALNIVFEGGIPCFADKPDAYRKSPAYRLYKNFPAVWDDSVLLEGEPGKYVTMMRRNGDNFYVGAICNEERDVNVDLSFLGEGEYYAEIFTDGNSLDEIKTDIIKVTNNDSINLELIKTGGASIKITKEGPSAPTELTLNKTELIMSENSTEKLEVSYKPENIDVKDVKWTSSNEEVVTVENGEILAHKEGTAVVTVTSAINEEIKASCTITVEGEKYKLLDRWSIIREDINNRKINSENSITIMSDEGNLYPGSYNGKNIVLTEIDQKENFEIETTLDYNPNENYQSAGLIVYGNDQNNFSIARRSHSGLGGKVLSTYNLTPSVYEGAIKDPNPGEKIHFKVKKEGNMFTSYYSVNGEKWILVDKTVKNDNVSNSDKIKVGVYAFNGSKASKKPAIFSNFKINGEEVPFAEEKIQEGLKPNKVTNLEANEVTNNSLLLKWDEVTNTRIKEYVIYKDGKEFEKVPATSTELKIEGLNKNTIYGFKVIAIGVDEQQSKPISINVRTTK